MLKCPNCGTTLELILQRTGDLPEPITGPVPHLWEPDPATTVDFILAGRRYSLSRNDIYSAAKEVSPDTILKYYVILPDSEGKERRFPIKQVVRRALRTKYGEKFVEHNFTAHRARDILLRLGFQVHEQ